MRERDREREGERENIFSTKPLKSTADQSIISHNFMLIVLHYLHATFIKEIKYKNINLSHNVAFYKQQFFPQTCFYGRLIQEFPQVKAESRKM